MTTENKKTTTLWENVKTILIAILIAVAIRTFAFEPFTIPSGSMIPTLLIGDYLFVSKYSYGYSRYSFPFGIGPFSGRVFFEPPKRGEVAVFKFPKNTSENWIKRIIGLPGDKIQIVNSVLNINGEPVKLERIEDFMHDTDSGEKVPVPQYIETLPNGVSHRIIKVHVKEEDSEWENSPEYIIPEGHYFMMGDNR
ncbi:MAG: signal peptidase I, partial [Alphaproteobacteria bacterium]|nr:signal peptidase I [Alphaproteobacteria bacterium]